MQFRTAIVGFDDWRAKILGRSWSPIRRTVPRIPWWFQQQGAFALVSRAAHWLQQWCPSSQARSARGIGSALLIPSGHDALPSGRPIGLGFFSRSSLSPPGCRRPALAADDVGEVPPRSRSRFPSCPFVEVRCGEINLVGGPRRFPRSPPLGISRPEAGSVGRAAQGRTRDAIPLGRPVAWRLEQPTRTVGIRHRSRNSCLGLPLTDSAPPLFVLLPWGLPCRSAFPLTCALLPHHFTPYRSPPPPPPCYPSPQGGGWKG